MVSKIAVLLCRIRCLKTLFTFSSSTERTDGELTELTDGELTERTDGELTERTDGELQARDEGKVYEIHIAASDKTIDHQQACTVTCTSFSVEEREWGILRKVLVIALLCTMSFFVASAYSLIGSFFSIEVMYVYLQHGGC